MQRMARIKSILVANVEMNGMELDSETHNDLLQIMKEGPSEIASKFPKNSFRQIFWKQQMKAALLKKSKADEMASIDGQMVPVCQANVIHCL